MYTNPMPNIKVVFHVVAWEEDEYYSEVDYGYTNSNGFVFLQCCIAGPSHLVLDYMRAYVSNPPYTALEAVGEETTSGSVIYPEFWVAIDLDCDYVADVQEEEIAEKFKPVLHKHSYDLSQGLANFEKHLVDGKFTLKVYDDWGKEQWSGVVSGSETALHKWSYWHWDTYGCGSVSHGVTNLNLANNVRYVSAPSGQRPIYYHVYKSGSYYYVQYWYYFGMNDISAQTDTWHESDWEHVSIRLTKNGSVFTPDKVNYYIHEGGKTVPASLCWWSPTNATTYSNIQQGYDEDHTHLHIWLAANAHASYNRYSLVLRNIFRLFAFAPLKDYVDRVDYSPTGYDLYFPYDQLAKLGEITKENYVECPDSGYTLEYHCYPIGSTSKHWLAYIGKLGDFYHTGPPFMPAKDPGNPSHEWTEFTDSPDFGNNNTWGGLYEMDIDWVPDNALGD